MSRKGQSGSLRRGQFVRVRPESEIAATLDADGKLDGMPFMPEMARHCGQVFRIYRWAGKTCVEGHSLRRLESAVLLEGLRCDGGLHDGCQRNCLFFWKEAWLEPVDAEAGEPAQAGAPEALSDWARGLRTRNGERYVCQSTELLGATRDLSRWNFTHFFAEIRAGELSFGRFLRILWATGLDRLSMGFHGKRRAALSGAGKCASRGDLELKAGDWVVVKPVDEIRLTLDPAGKNHGLSFEPDMAGFTGRRFQVEFPIRKIILEQTGKMIPLEHTVALKGVACDGLCTKNCPRNNTLYWRKAWLNRVETSQETGA
ncbi:MAG TPA: hypothetical protein VNV60_09645 [Holophagaceae bacterium]|jgi:hypothetical protein|nr:hypothetical protein [Holophagaceae bacterium]